MPNGLLPIVMAAAQTGGELNFFQAIVIAIVQGVTELFPVSSLGHAVILPHLLRWDIEQDSPTFLPFLVLLHVGTALALLVYFWRDWWTLLSSLLGPGKPARRQPSRATCCCCSCSARSRPACSD